MNKAGLEEHGVKVEKLSDNQLEKFREATQPAYDKWSEKVGYDLVRTFEDAIESASNEE